MKTILLIEDEIILGTSIRDFLQSNGFEVIWAQNLQAASKPNKEPVDLILLDWNLPDGNGLNWLRSLPPEHPPVIMLTAKAELTDKVLGLEFGASDYITKPFETRELLARINVQLRGSHSKTAVTKIEISGIAMHLDSHDVWYAGAVVQLTKIEFELLKVFLENPGKVFSREALLEKVWQQRSVSTRTIDVHLGQLRQKFKAELFETLHGVGYRFMPEKTV